MCGPVESLPACLPVVCAAAAAVGVQVVFTEASAAAGHTVDRVISIMDADGLTLSKLTGFAQRVSPRKEGRLCMMHVTGHSTHAQQPWGVLQYLKGWRLAPHYDRLGRWSPVQLLWVPALTCFAWDICGRVTAHLPTPGQDTFRAHLPCCAVLLTPTLCWASSPPLPPPLPQNTHTTPSAVPADHCDGQ